MPTTPADLRRLAKDAFPDIRIITHAKTRDLMLGPALAFNQPGLDRDLPAYVTALEQKVTAARAPASPPADLAALDARLAAGRFFLAEKRRVRHTAANLTFTTRLDIHMGGRHIQVLHHDRAVTPGDAFLYLPNERLLVTGDLVVNPIPFALSVYPSGWLATLERLDALDAAVIVPGHGEPLRDETLLKATIALFRELLMRGREAREKGLDVDAARDAMLPGLDALKHTLTRGAPALDAPFRIYLVDWFLHRVYDELAGPLTDEIAPIPAR